MILQRLTLKSTVMRQQKGATKPEVPVDVIHKSDLVGCSFICISINPWLGLKAKSALNFSQNIEVRSGN